MRFKFLQFFDTQKNLSYDERRQKHVWPTAIILTRKNEKQHYINNIWPKVFKQNTLKKHIKNFGFLKFPELFSNAPTIFRYQWAYLLRKQF